EGTIGNVQFTIFRNDSFSVISHDQRFANAEISQINNSHEIVCGRIPCRLVRNISLASHHSSIARMVEPGCNRGDILKRVSIYHRNLVREIGNQERSVSVEEHRLHESAHRLTRIYE